MIFPGDWPSPANDRPEPIGPFDPMDPRGWDLYVQPHYTGDAGAAVYRQPHYIAHGEHLAEVDPELWPILARYSWNSFFTRAGKRYFRRSQGFKRVVRAPGQRLYGNKTVLLHRAVMDAAGDPAPEPGLVVDHIDGNELDCRYGNLRWTTYLGNSLNRPDANGNRPALMAAE